ncbi:MAG: hypothetical protein IT424_07590 [Pirellulales bacterium]|nr:hypothetical protein [Pirellulales bacterium]
MLLCASPFSVRGLRRWKLISTALLLSSGLLARSAPATAAVMFQGSVTPEPLAAGGNVGAPFKVGATGVGVLSIGGATPLSVTGGNSTWVGDAAAGVGIVTASGFGSNFSAGSDLHIGNAGVGSVSVQVQAQVTASDDFILGEDGGSAGQLFVDGLGSIASAGDDAFIGQEGQGLVQITKGGRVLADAVVLGQTASSDGAMTISDNTSLWEGRGTMTIGDQGRGTLQIVSQGRAENTAAVVGNATGSIGSAEVNGAGSLWTIGGTLNIGVSGDGLMRVLNGGRAAATGAVTLGNSAGSEGRAEINGAGSVLSTNASLTVGNSGFGTFYILTGGRAATQAVTLGDQTAGRAEVIVDGDGSTWEIAGALTVSEPGEARMTISTSARVTTTAGVAIGANGQMLFGGGRLEVGSGTLTNNGLILGGGRIVSSVINTAGAQIRTDGSSIMTVSGGLTNGGLVSLEGGQLQVNGATTNNQDIALRSSVARFRGGLTNAAGGQLSAVAGSIDFFGAIANDAGAQIVVGGGAAAVFHDAVANSGQLFVMPGSNALMLDDLSFGPASALSLQLSSANLVNGAGPIEVAGAASLGGVLEVSLAGGFVPQIGQTFRLLTAAGGLTGAFTTEMLPGLADGLSWNVQYAPTAVTLSVAPGPSADFNDDGQVDASDLTAWEDGFGTAGGATPGQGDANGDGAVDGRDFLAWQRQLGTSPAAAVAAAAVPEPSCSLLLIAAWSGLWGSVRQRRP